MKKIKASFSVLLCLTLSLLLIQVGCDRKLRPVTGLKQGVWFVSPDLQVAMIFLEEGANAHGEYMPLGSGLAEKHPFTVRAVRKGVQFSFSAHPDLDVTGVLEQAENGYVLSIEKGKRALLREVQTDSLPRIPGRYAVPVFSRVMRTERVYGYAPGYYSSKPMQDLSPQAYPQIVLSVLTDVTMNLFRDSVKLDMDIYYPEDDQIKNRPLIIMIHGGAFIVGDKRGELARRLSTYYAQCGYVVASINYRMGYPAVPGMHSQLERAIYRGIQDTRAALRYLSHHRDEFRIDPDQVFLMGNSAGGFYSLLTAFKQEEERWGSSGRDLFGLRKELGCLDCSGNNLKGKFTIKGVVNMWGGITELSLIDRNEKIPTLLIHGTADRIVSYDYDFPFKQIDTRLSSAFTRKMYGSKPIHDHMQRLGMDVRLITIPDGQHEPQADDTLVYEMIRSEIRDFMHRVQSGTPLRINGPKTLTAGMEVARYVALNHQDLPLKWHVEGGVVIRRSSTWVEVVWIAGTTQKSVTVATMNSRGLVRSERMRVGG